MSVFRVTKLRKDQAGRFAEGASGNPGGRPKGAVEARDLARKHTVSAINRLVAVMQ
jgi:hypothetical protein